MLQFVINVDEKMFEEKFKSEVDAFPKEELKTIIRDAFIEYLKTNAESMFLQKTKSGYGRPMEEVRPSQIMYDAARTLNLHPAFEEVQQGLLETLENNYPEILRSVLTHYIIDGITANGQFTNNIKKVIFETVNSMNKMPGGN